MLVVVIEWFALKEKQSCDRNLKLAHYFKFLKKAQLGGITCYYGEGNCKTNVS